MDPRGTIRTPANNAIVYVLSKGRSKLVSILILYGVQRAVRELAQVINEGNEFNRLL